MTKTLAFTFVCELTWKPLHFCLALTLQTAIACITSLFPTLINFINQVASHFSVISLLAQRQAPLFCVLN
jgi:hypothetical protein